MKHFSSSSHPFQGKRLQRRGCEGSTAVVFLSLSGKDCDEPPLQLEMTLQVAGRNRCRKRGINYEFSERCKIVFFKSQAGISHGEAGSFDSALVLILLLTFIENFDGSSKSFTDDFFLKMTCQINI